MAEMETVAAAEAQGPPKGVVPRLIGVIASPGEAMREIVARPEAMPPLVVYLVLLVVCTLISGMRANWEAITSDRVENFFIMEMLNDQQKDEAVRQAVAQIKEKTQTQMAVENTLQAFVFVPIVFQITAVFFSTLFVLMGALTALKLGRAWLQVGLSILVLIAWIIVQVISRTAFGTASDSGTVLMATSSIVLVGVILWLMMRHSRSDPAYHSMFSVVTYTSAVGIIALLVTLAITFANPESASIPMEKLVKSSVGNWVTLGIPILDSLLKSLDVFTLWNLTVLTIGFRWATRLSTGVTAMITFLPWGVYVLIKLAWAAVFG